MKRKLQASQVVPGHPDHDLLTDLAADLIRRGGGQAALSKGFTTMLRTCIDDVIMTPKTGRRSYEELEKTEKTYIGTRVEIELKALLNLPNGKLDTRILGRDVDIKNTMGSNWMIPTEAIGHPCILVAADEARAVCYLGLILARPEYLTKGQNKDAKRSISAEGFSHILWLLRESPYPANFWRGIAPDIVNRIFAGKTGNARVIALFEHLQGQPVSRDVVEAVARQSDFMRRIRADKGRGTRDQLARAGILLLSGQYDSALIRALGLPDCPGNSFISYAPQTASDREKAHAAGFQLESDRLI